MFIFNIGLGDYCWFPAPILKGFVNLVNFCQWPVSNGNDSTMYKNAKNKGFIVQTGHLRAFKTGKRDIFTYSMSHVIFATVNT